VSRKLWKLEGKRWGGREGRKKEEMEDGERHALVMGKTLCVCFTGGGLVGQISAGSPAADVRKLSTTFVHIFRSLVTEYLVPVLSIVLHYLPPYPES